MKLNELKPAAGSKKTRRRVGRGLGSGRGKTAGRGQKGQASRAGFSQGAGWEGGRSRLIMRLPKRGFNKVKLVYQIVNVGDLNGFDEGATVDIEALVMAGLVRHVTRPVKLLANGVLEVRGLDVEVDACSAAAAQAVVAAGGSVTVAAADAEADALESADGEVGDAAAAAGEEETA
ncbi:MAG: 50S ribosomal protein L15 [bacterium]|nr:50S ribosomal protein L15 [bacterium]